MPETELVHKIKDALLVQRIPRRHDYYFIRLKKYENQQSAIEWVKGFSNNEDLFDFYWDTKFERACMMTKFDKEIHKVLCWGNFLCSRFEIQNGWMVHINEPLVRVRDIEGRKMIPRELVEGAFEDIHRQLSNLKAS